MVKRHGWDEKFKQAEAETPAALIALKKVFPDVTEFKSTTKKQDLLGADKFMVLSNGVEYAIDLKIQFGNDSTDKLPLESWSKAYEDPTNSTPTDKWRVGWTRDPKKKTHYVVWYWPKSKRIHVIPYPELREVFIRMWQYWLSTFESSVQGTPLGTTKFIRWYSQCVYVPIKEIRRCMDLFYSGQSL